MIDEENQQHGAEGAAVESAEAISTDSTEEVAGVDEPMTAPVEDLTENGSIAAEDSAESIAAEYMATIAALQTEIQTLKTQLDDRTSQQVRLAADFDNFRKRTQREREELEQQIKCSTINELLPVVDNFERARSQIKPQTDAETTIHKSYQSVYKQLVDCLKRVGVAPMRAEGKEFDPNLHEAVMRQPTDEFPEGTVMEELQRGYLMGERVLRHALVKVAAPPEPGVNSEENLDNPAI